MKNALFILSACISLGSCHKKDTIPTIPDTPETLPPFTGTYIGKSTIHSASLEEIFQNPQNPQYVWQYDSSTVDPDTLRVMEIAADSFAVMPANFAITFQELQRFSYADSTGSKLVDYENYFGLPTYFSIHLQASFDRKLGMVKFLYTDEQNTPERNLVREFTGVRQ